MPRKIGRGDAPAVMLGLFRYLERRSPATIWFRLSIKDWSKSNGRCYQTGLKAIQDLAAASGDFEAPAGRKRVAQVLSSAVARGSQEFKFRCLQITRKGRNASFVWHVAPRSRLLWDKEPLFYLRDKKTERHVRRQLRSLDIEVTKDGEIIFGNLVCEQLELGLNVHRAEKLKQGELGLIFAEQASAGQLKLGFDPFVEKTQCSVWKTQCSDVPLHVYFNTLTKGTSFKSDKGQYRTSVVPLYEREIRLQQYTNPPETRAAPGCSHGGLGRLRRKAHVLLPEIEDIHECSTGKVPFSEGHAVSFLLNGLKEGYQERKILRSYRRAHEFATAYVSDGLARTPLAVLLWRAKWELKQTDNLTQSRRIKAFYTERDEDSKKLETLKSGVRPKAPESGHVPSPRHTGPACECNRNALRPVFPPC